MASEVLDVFDLFDKLREEVSSLKERAESYRQLKPNLSMLITAKDNAAASFTLIKAKYRRVKDCLLQEDRDLWKLRLGSIRNKIELASMNVLTLNESIPMNHNSNSNPLKEVKNKASIFFRAISLSSQMEALSSLLVSLFESIITLSSELGDLLTGFDIFTSDSSTIPSLPDNVVHHFNNLDTMEGKLLEAVRQGMETGNGKITAATAAATASSHSVSGMGGVGKTCALIGLAGHLKGFFEGGVYFMKFGADATDETFKRELKWILMKSGGVRLSEKSFDTVRQVVNIARLWFEGRKVLFVCDDLWEVKENSCRGNPYRYLEELKPLIDKSNGNYMVISTRSTKIANLAERIVEFGPRSTEGDEAKEYIFAHAKITSAQLSSCTPEAKIAFTDILQKCSGFPMTLAVAGNAIRSLYGNSDDDLSSSLVTFSERIEESSFPYNPLNDILLSYPHFSSTVQASLSVCEDYVAMLLSSNAQSGNLCTTLFCRLFLLRKQSRVSRAILLKIWGDHKGSAGFLIKKLVDLHLLIEQKGSYGIHDLVHDFCTSKAGEEGGCALLHRRFLYSVYTSTDGSFPLDDPFLSNSSNFWDCQQVSNCGRDWWTLFNENTDGTVGEYMGSNLARHLVKGERPGELLYVLSDIRWTRMRMSVGGWISLHNDFNELLQKLNAMVVTLNDDGQEIIRQSIVDVNLLRNAIHHFWLFVVENKDSLNTQAFMHLLDIPTNGWVIKKYLSSTDNCGPSVWLKPLRRCFAIPTASSSIYSIGFEAKFIFADWQREEVLVVGEDQKSVILYFVHQKKETVPIPRNFASLSAALSVYSSVLTNIISRSAVDDITEEDSRFARRARDNLAVDISWMECVGMSEDESRIASRWRNNTVLVWDVKTCRKVCETMQGITGCVSAVAISGDGQFVAFISGIESVRVWDVDQESCVGAVMEGHNHSVRCVDMSVDCGRVVTGSEDKHVRVWDKDSGKQICEPMQGHTDWVRSVAISADGTRVVSGSDDMTVRIWHVDSPQQAGKVMRGHTGYVKCVGMCEDGLRVVSGSDDTTVRVWDSDSGQQVGETLEGHTDWVTSVSMSADGESIVSGSDDGCVCIWNVKLSTKVRQIMEGPFPYMKSVAMSGCGQRIATGGADGLLRIWNVESGEQVGNTILGHSDGVRSLAMTVDGRRVVSGSVDNGVRVWDVSSGNQIGNVMPGHQEDVRSVAMSADGRRIVSGSDDKTVRAWDAHTGLQIGNAMEGHTKEVRSVAISADGKIAASASNDKSVLAWNVESGRQIGGAFEGHSKGVTSIAISSDGRYIISGSDDSTIRRWDLESDDSTIRVADSGSAVEVVEVVEGISRRSRDISNVVMSANGLRVVSTDEDRKVYLWNAKDGTEVREVLKVDSSFLKIVGMSLDGYRFVSVSDDNVLRAWDVESGMRIGKDMSRHITDTETKLVHVHLDRLTEEKLKLKDTNASSTSNSRVGRQRVPLDESVGAVANRRNGGHGNDITSVAMSKDGRRVVSGSKDRAIRVWDVESGLQLGVDMCRHEKYVRSVAMSKDGQRIVSGSDDENVAVWDAGTQRKVSTSMTGYTSDVLCVAMSADGRHAVSGAGGSYHGLVRVWVVESGLQRGVDMKGHTMSVSSVAISSNGKFAVSGSYDKTLRVWDIDLRQLIGVAIEGHTDCVNSVAMSANGQRVVSGSDDQSVRVWGMMPRLQITKVMVGHTDCVESVAISRDGLRVVSGSKDMTVRVWDVESGDHTTMEGHANTVNSVAMSEDGGRVVSGSNDSTIRVWEVNSARICKAIHVIRGHIGSVRSVVISLDGKIVVSGSDDKTVRVWNVKSGVQVGQSMYGHTKRIFSVAMSRNGQRVVSGSADKSIFFWDVESKTQIGEAKQGHTDFVRSVAIGADGTHAVSGSFDSSVLVWDTQSGMQVGESMRRHKARVSSVAMIGNVRHVLHEEADPAPRVTGNGVARDYSLVVSNSAVGSSSSSQGTGNGCGKILLICSVSNAKRMILSLFFEGNEFSGRNERHEVLEVLELPSIGKSVDMQLLPTSTRGGVFARVAVGTEQNMVLFFDVVRSSSRRAS